MFHAFLSANTSQRDVLQCFHFIHSFINLHEKGKKKLAARCSTEWVMSPILQASYLTLLDSWKASSTTTQCLKGEKSLHNFPLFLWNLLGIRRQINFDSLIYVFITIKSQKSGSLRQKRKLIQQRLDFTCQLMVLSFFCTITICKDED